MGKLALNIMPGRSDCFEYLLYPAENVQMHSWGMYFPQLLPEQNDEPINFIVYVPEELRGLAHLDLNIYIVMQVDGVCFFDTDCYTWNTTINGMQVQAVGNDLNPGLIYTSGGRPVGYGGFYMYQAILDIGPLLTSAVEYFELCLRRSEDEPLHGAWFVLASTDPEIQEV